jgi:hypothetical protein
MTNKSILWVCFVSFLMQRCSNNSLDVNVENVKVSLQFVNLDSVFVHADSVSLMNYHHDFNRSIKEIYEYELGYCLGLGNGSDSTFFKGVNLFTHDAYIQRLEKQIGHTFSNLTTEKEQLVAGFKHLKYHVPNGKMPQTIVFMNSFFAANAFATERQIGVGLERYLGEKSKVIQELPSQEFPAWIRKAMNKKFLSRDVLCSWILTHYVSETSGNLAEEMVRWGKILYLTQASFPHENPALIMRYSDEQYAWALDHEYSFWNYLVNQKMLFKSNDLTNVNLLNDGPFSAGFDEKSPDRMGQFIGFRMIQKYMEITDDTVEEMLKKPYEEILVEYEIE